MFTIISPPLLLASLGSAVLGWLMFFLSIFLILLILVQRGKGGGLTGALGGPGGQSAFGSKAGDTFTLITAVSAIIWGFVCAVAMYTLGVPPLTADDASFEIDDTPALTSPADTAEGAAGGGLSGLSGILSDETEPGDSSEPQTEGEPAAETEATSSGTPSLELTPAETTTTETAADESAAGDENPATSDE